MTKRRDDDFSIDAALGDPGFTPRQKDVRALLERVTSAEDALRARAEKALLRVQSPIAEAVRELTRGSAGEARVRLLRLAGQLLAREGDGDAAFALLSSNLTSDDARARRAAATALGKLATAHGEEVLLHALDRERVDGDPRVLEAIIEALGKVGGEASLRALAPLEGTVAAHSALERAKLMLSRTTLRRETSRLSLDRTLDVPVTVSLRCRRGLAPILVDELRERCSRELAPREGDGDRVDVTLRGAPSQLFVARTFLTFGFVLEERRSPDEDLAASVVRALASERARALLRRFTDGPIRFRVAWAGGGKRRKAVWDVAAEIGRRAPELVNDPTDSSWEVSVHESATSIRLELVPRVDDPRFTYRTADVPAASHPTIAAALVRAAEVREDDVVWDPFVGSGGELCERFLAGPAAMLIGSDVDDRALRAARENLDRADATMALLRKADARSFDPRAIGGRARHGMTTIVSNPPMGRRVMRGEDLEHLVTRVVARAADILAPGGRLVWLSPLPRATRTAARRAGLELRRATDVDMGGFDAELQILERPSRP